MNGFFLILILIFSSILYLSVDLLDDLHASVKDVRYINVLVGRSLSTIVLKGVDVERQVFLGKVVKKYKEKIPGLKGIRFQCNDFKTQKKNEKLKLLAMVSSPTGILTWEDDKYRGDFYIVGSDINGHCDLINRVSLENYLSTLLPKEMNGNWNIEALKAQAVASRTYALYMKMIRERNADLLNVSGNESVVYYDLENSERHQVSGHLFDENSNTAMATKLTAGEILLPEMSGGGGGGLSAIFFHAQCGGRTLNTEDVWSEKIEAYQSVKCPYCSGIADLKYWEVYINRSSFYNFVRKSNLHIFKNLKDSKETNFIQTMKLVPDSFERTSVNFYLEGELFTVKKAKIRNVLGQQKIFSNNFIFKKDGDRFYIRGRGRGHGVGMCQVGALYLANQGWDYKRILKYYYPNHKLVQNYGL
ncbi:MAG: SpoIID/LytB domain-containing protein [Oligoflexia bacterium]|nr:SpoIID/LytB domain-containing protein [Oligoflexia bacterium]